MSLSLKQMLERCPLGSQHFVTLEGGHVTILVEVVDLRQTFGRLDAKVAPVNGWGEMWVDSARFIAPSEDPRAEGQQEVQEAE